MPKKIIKQDERTRNWSFIVYPDSAPSDWEKILTEKYNLQWARSPLHDADLNADNTEKKPHWHVLVSFKGNKNYAQVKEIADSINATIPQKVHNVRGLVRYMAHLDNPEKAQYKVDNIKAVGIDIEQYLFSVGEQKERRLNGIKEMIRFIDEQGLSEFTHILSYSAENEPYWFELLCSNSAYVINCYLKSRRYELEKSQKGLK